MVARRSKGLLRPLARPQLFSWFPMRIQTLLLGCLVLAVSSRSAHGQSGGKTIEVTDAQVSLIQNAFVATSIAGLVAEVPVREGDRVEPGDRLIQLDTEQAQTELEAAKATHDATKLQSDNNVHVRYAQRTMEVRQRELEQSHEANQRYAGTVSESEISKQQLEVDQARLAIEQAEHDQLVAGARVREKQAAILMAAANLRRHGITAPVSGEVVEIAVEPGEWVDTGKPVVRIISLDPIRVECFIVGASNGDELVGRKVEFFPEVQSEPSTPAATPLVGQVTFVSLELHPVTGQARLWATIANPDRTVRAGMHGRLVIHAP